MFVGIDVGADRLHCVAIASDGRLLDGKVFPPTAVADLTLWLRPAEAVAIDAPATLSAGPHTTDEALSPKFRSARCAEIALGASIACGFRGQHPHRRCQSRRG